MPSSELLPIPRLSWHGALTERCRKIPLVGKWAGKVMRVERKRFLAGLKHPDHLRHIRRILSHPVGKEFDAAMKEWLAQDRAPACAHQASSFPIPSTPGGIRPRCSVVINTVDRAGDLEITLEALRAHLDPTKDELILVLGPSSDESEKLIRSNPLPHKLIHCPLRNLGVSRNLGLHAAAGHFVAYIDDDASPEAGWLDELLAPMENDSQTAVTAGFVLDGKGHRFLNRYLVADTLGRNWSFDDEATAIACIQKLGSERAFPYATGCNMAFRREILVKIGGFDEAFRYFLEETDAIWRILLEGYKCTPAPNSRVRHRLGANLAREPGFQIDERTVIIRSQIHFIGKFGKRSFTHTEVETTLWERILRDLEKISWDCRERSSPGVSCEEIQIEYLRVVTDDLKRSTSLT